ncbi:MAG: hypothetical protein F2873_02335 [Actinobacteria bacterium]|nr:hypothetical protein [Actinomycetota bacterium]MSX80674.1 hypothetical protein [Actinomycetota bacterium]
MSPVDVDERVVLIVVVDDREAIEIDRDVVGGDVEDCGTGRRCFPGAVEVLGQDQVSGDG